MKKIKLFICLLTVICAYSLCACSQSKSVMSDESKRIYTANEKNFIDEYLKATEENLDLSEITDPSNDPTSSDFAVITLNKQYYGTDAFAFLPLKFRQLTKDEILQLVKIYGNINPKEILDQSSSYQKVNSDNIEINSNRDLSTKEVFQSRFELLAQYFTEGLRPKEKINTSPNNGNPLCISVYTSNRFWIYPKKEMTEEQLLQTIDALYCELPSEWYSATSEQISHTKAAQAAGALSKQYKIVIKHQLKLIPYMSLPRREMRIYRLLSNANAETFGMFIYTLRVDMITQSPWMPMMEHFKSGCVILKTFFLNKGIW